MNYEFDILTKEAYEQLEKNDDIECMTVLSMIRNVKNSKIFKKSIGMSLQEKIKSTK